MATIISRKTTSKQARSKLSGAKKKIVYPLVDDLAGKLGSKIDPVHFQRKMRDEWK